jgi:CheY-like chemotaxis protein
MNNDCQILVVDDDHEDHLILRDYFSDAGKDQCVRFIDNGKKAIEFLEQTGDEDLPRLIVLDLNMPILNGTQTLLKLKATPRLRNIPVIVFSTSENENEKRKCLSFGAIDYMVKPVGFEDGKRMVNKFMSFLDEN